MAKKQKILLGLKQQRRELELLHMTIPQQMSRIVKQNEAVKMLPNLPLLKNTPRAVVNPPVNSSQPVTPPKVKIAPVTSALLEAVKLRDPRLNKRNEPSVSKKVEPEVNLVEDLIRQQKTQSIMSQNFTRTVEDKVIHYLINFKFFNNFLIQVPEAKVAEEEIQQRQMAMLKAPVLGQLNRKGNDEKSRRRSSPSHSNRNHRDISKSNDKSKHKDDKSRKKSSRDKNSRHSSKSEENRHDRKRDKRDKFKESKLEPTFSPTSSDSQSSPRPMKRLSPVPPPPPVIGSSNTTEEPMDLDDSPPIVKKISPRRDGVTFKNVKGTLKSRNYSRRNKERSPSPLDSPPQEKLARISAGMAATGALVAPKSAIKIFCLIGVAKDLPFPGVWSCFVTVFCFCSFFLKNKIFNQKSNDVKVYFWEKEFFVLSTMKPLSPGLVYFSFCILIIIFNVNIG